MEFVTNGKTGQNMTKVSAPGRICLFGEHQDYLGLPVVTMAINLRISITAAPRPDRIFLLNMPDIGQCEEIDLSVPVLYSKERDYLRSGLNAVLRLGIHFDHGYDCTIQGNIPINSGTSSSSALVVAWIKLLLTLAGDARAADAVEVARLAHQAEVLEFKEPGGMMDHYATSLGAVLYIEFNQPIRIESLPAQLGTFVLGDSMEPKDTKGILARVKDGTLNALSLLSQQNPASTMGNITQKDIDQHSHLLSASQQELLSANVVNRDLTQQARQLLQNPIIDHHQLGRLLNAHQNELRERLRISTAKIDRMLDAALQSGALGGKINGSGGGGCMFVYAPFRTDQIAQAIETAGGKAMIIQCDSGCIAF
jgi:galactokinase